MDSKTGVDVAREMGIAHPGPAVLHVVERGSIGEAVAGGGAVILAVLGLIGLLPQTLCAIAVLAAGAALLLGGAAVVARHGELTGLSPGRRAVTGGMEVVAFGGVAALVLGILALLAVDPLTLLPIAAIVVGAALLAEGSAVGRLDTMMIGRGQSVGRTEEALQGATGFDVVIGIGAVILGILALSGSNPIVLTLVSMLAVGIAVVFSGSSLAARIYEMVG